MLAIFIISVIVFIVSAYFIYRNVQTLKECILILDAIRYYNENYEHFQHLMSLDREVEYDYVLIKKFWVWPIYKLWPEELQKIRNDYKNLKNV